MQLKLYKNLSEKARIGKTLVEEIDMTGVLHGESSVIDPTILINATQSIAGYNYMYINEFKRFYFINNIVAVRNGLFRVEAHVDVLESFEAPIKALSVIIDKQEKASFNKYLDSGDWVTTCKQFTNVLSFPNGFNESGEYILLVAGG